MKATPPISSPTSRSTGSRIATRRSRLCSCASTARRTANGRRARHLGHDKDRKYPSRTRCSTTCPAAGRTRTGHDYRQDHERDRPGSSQRLHRSHPNRRRSGMSTTSHGTRHFARRSWKAKTSCAGNTTATCTITSVASKPWTKASASCSTTSTRRGSRRTRSWSTLIGFYLGEHGWFGTADLRRIASTPSVRWPGMTKPGTTNANLVSNIDFAATSSWKPREWNRPAHARPQPGPDSEGPNARRLPRELLLPLLRVPRPADLSAATTAS